MYLLSMRRWPLGSGSGSMNPLGERRGAAGGLESVVALRPFDCFWSSITFFDSRVSLKLTFKGKLSIAVKLSKGTRPDPSCQADRSKISTRP